MNIYLVSRTDGADYDEYDAFVCYAPSAGDAARMHPRENEYVWNGNDWALKKNPTLTDSTDWPPPTELTVTFLGVAQSADAAIILASFNAG